MAASASRSSWSSADPAGELPCINTITTRSYTSIEGRSKWRVGDQEREAVAGDVLIVRAGEPHKFINSGDGPLRQIDIHLSPNFETVWLEE
jgi:mannose-6-phosphate isomerase-like protein (cupin superfamily)